MVSDKRVIITGGASGQGRATASLLARAGYIVAALDRDTDGLSTLAKELADHAITTHALDVASFAEVEDIVNQVASNGGVDALLACAAIHGSYDPLASGDPLHWSKVLSVNVMGVENCVRACLPHMLSQERGDIIIWGSVAALSPVPNEATYSASKAAVAHLADSLRHEVAASGIKVSVIHPGITHTPLMEESPATAQLLEAIKLEPLRPEDIARCAQFMLEQPDGCAISEIIVRPARLAF
jgi:NADP-dependent 3-hydroxy acid dehydrogenase YdfG